MREHPWEAFVGLFIYLFIWPAGCFWFSVCCLFPQCGQVIIPSKGCVVTWSMSAPKEVGLKGSTWLQDFWAVAVRVSHTFPGWWG